MKIRAGFVSNSSSSSFAIVAEREAFLKMVKELPPLCRAYVETLGWEEDKICDLEVVKFEHMTGNCSSMEYDFDHDKMLATAKKYGWEDEEIEEDWGGTELEWARENEDWQEAPDVAQAKMEQSSELKHTSVKVEQDF